LGIRAGLGTQVAAPKQKWSKLVSDEDKKALISVSGENPILPYAETPVSFPVHTCTISLSFCPL
jgi:hypothetical protein